MDDRFVTTVWTDGLGGFQARCQHCAWRSRWFESGRLWEREQKAQEEAKQHGATHANQPTNGS